MTAQIEWFKKAEYLTNDNLVIMKVKAMEKDSDRQGQEGDHEHSTDEAADT